MNTFDWTTRIVTTLALTLAAGCTVGLDADTAELAGSYEGANTDTFDRPDVGDTNPTSPGGDNDVLPDGDTEEPDATTEGEETTSGEETTEGEETKPEEDRVEETAPDGVSAACIAPPDAGEDGILICLDEVNAEGGQVFIGAGDYVITKTIALPSGVTLVGEGPATRLILDGGLDQPVLLVGSTDETPTGERVSGVTIANLTIDGARFDQSSESVPGAPWLSTAGIAIRHAISVQVQGVTVTETAGAGIQVDASAHDVLIQGANVNGSGFDGIAVSNSHNVSILGTVVTGNEGAGLSFDWGVTESLVLDSEITSNGGGWAGGQNPGVYVAMTSNTVFQGNTIADNDGNGVVLTNQGMAQSPAATCSMNNAFNDNVIEGNQQFGIWLTHTTCVGNSSTGNTYVNNAWGPVFEPVCGQLREDKTACEGSGCPNACAIQ